MDKNVVIEFYNSLLKKRIEDFVSGNERVYRATEEVCKWIKIYSPKSVLEIGCGIGDVSFKIASEFPELEIIGFDISEDTIDFGKENFKRPNYQLIFSENFISLKKKFERKRFDFIYLIDVFEHFDEENIVEFIEFVKEYMNPKGFVFFSCPTIEHQNYLRLQNPKGIQPIDRDISIIDFLDLADKLNFKLYYFKTLSIWNFSDYQHSVIGNIDIKGGFSDNVKINNVGFKDMLIKRFLGQKKNLSEYDRVRNRIKHELKGI